MAQADAVLRRGLFLKNPSGEARRKRAEMLRAHTPLIRPDLVCRANLRSESRARRGFPLVASRPAFLLSAHRPLLNSGASPLMALRGGERAQRASLGQGKFGRNGVALSRNGRRSSGKRGQVAKAVASPEPFPMMGRPASWWRRAWQRVTAPLRELGIGRRSLWEGGVGLFLMIGVGVFWMCISWVKGWHIGSQKTYQAHIEFPFAYGIQSGTPVRIRGVKVGRVLKVRPELNKVDVTIEVDDDSIHIPKNALVEANQSGIIAECLVDVTPVEPAQASPVGPHDPNCETDGSIVCHRSKIKGVQGISIDGFIRICTKIALEMDKIGIQSLSKTGDTLVETLEKSKPLLSQITSTVGELEPVLKDLKQTELVAALERLATKVDMTLSDMRSLRTAENTDALKDAATALTRTLRHLESIASDIASATGSQTLRNLLQTLSRVVD